MNTVRMRLEARESESGGSLIELVIATAIAIVLVGAVMHITVHSSKVRKADEELRLAWSACRNIVEEVRILPVDQIPALNGQGFDVPSSQAAIFCMTTLRGTSDERSLRSARSGQK